MLSNPRWGASAIRDPFPVSVPGLMRELELTDAPPIPNESLTVLIQHVEQNYRGDHPLFRGPPSGEQLFPPIGRESFVPRKGFTQSDRHDNHFCQHTFGSF